MENPCIMKNICPETTLRKLETISLRLLRLFSYFFLAAAAGSCLSRLVCSFNGERKNEDVKSEASNVNEARKGKHCMHSRRYFMSLFQIYIKNVI